MKNKNKLTIAHNVFELAEALSLTPADAVEIEVRSALNDKVIEIVKKHHLTHVQVAKIAETSRTRITAILNRNTVGVSTDSLVRILASLGIKTKVSFSKAA